MSRTTTLTALMLDVRTRTNMENDPLVGDAELTVWFNQSLAKLWRRIVQNEGQPFYRSSTSYTVTSATTLQALPSDFYQVQEVTATIGGVTGALTPFMAGERGFLQNAQVWSPNLGVQYRIQGANIEFLPASQSFTATLFYSPTQPRLVNGSDTFDGFAGYEEAAICEVCARVQAKREADASFYSNSALAIYADIDSQIAARDAANPERVQDVIGASNAFGWYR